MTELYNLDKIKSNVGKKNLTILIISLLVVSVSANAYLFSVADTASQEDDKVKVVTSELVGFEPLSYAISNNKVPEPEGLHVEFETASMSVAELNTRATDEPIVGILSNVRLAKAYNDGEDFKVLAPWYREGMSPYGDTVGQLVTSADSDIDEPKDLEGKRVGLQGLEGGSATAAMTALREEGVDLSTITFEGVDEQTGPTLVREGELAAAQVDSSVIMQEDFSDTYKTALDFGKVLHEEYGAVPPSQFVVVRQEDYEENPEKYDRALEWLRQNYQWARENDKQIAEKTTQLEDTEAYGEPVDLLTKKTDYFTRLGEIKDKDLAVLEAYFQTAKEQGTIEEVPNLEKVFDK